MRERVKAWALLAAAGAVAAVGAAGADGAKDEIKRRGFFGASLGPVGPEARAAQKIEGGGGAEVVGVIAGSSAEAGGVKPGDVLLAVNGAEVKAPGDVIQAVGRRLPGDALDVDLVRDARKLHLKVTLKERPRETSDAFETLYGSVNTRAGRLRTIVTRPRAPGKFPALFLIQGIGCYSVEGLPGRPSEFQRIAGAFTNYDYVTLRVEKPGCGDSEGGPCPDVVFETELDGYRQGLKALKAFDFVDRDRVFLFGHSLGGLWAPVLASEEPVKGVAVYGTVLKPWFEYELENRRRQLALQGVPLPEADREMRAFATLLHGVYLERKSPRQVAEAHPEVRDLREQLSPDDEHVYGRSVAFMRQVAALPVSEYWSKVDAHVLAVWGKAEYISTEADHRALADLINRAHPGRGTFLALDGIDHGFHRAASAAARYQAVLSGAPSEFNPAIIDALRAWADPLAKAP